MDLGQEELRASQYAIDKYLSLIGRAQEAVLRTSELLDMHRALKKIEARQPVRSMEFMGPRASR